MDFKVISLMVLAVLMSACIGGGGETTPSGDTGGAMTDEGDVDSTMDDDSGMMGDPGSEGGSDVLRDLTAAFSSGLGYKCTYRDEQGMSEMWVEGGRYHSITTVQGERYHTLSDGTWAYMWVEGETTGTKFKPEDFEDEEAETAEYEDVDDVAAAAVNVECHPEAIAGSRFVPPGNVQFQDMGEMMEQMQQMGENMEQDPCAYCEMLPAGESRDQCLANC